MLLIICRARDDTDNVKVCMHIYEENISQKDALLGVLQHNVNRYQKIVSNKRDYNTYNEIIGNFWDRKHEKGDILN